MHIEIRGAERLSFRERQVVVLKETGYASRQIAERLGLSLASVATLLNRAKRKGYQVVIVIDGDPLSLFGTNDGDEDGEEEEPDEEGAEG